MKPIIIAIVGGSGSGKTTLSLEMKEYAGIPTIVSYTTRPMRPSEVDGVDHWFVSEFPKDITPLAYTIYGDYEYWAVLPTYKICSYVIDEKGLEELTEKWGEDYRIIPVKINRTDRSDISPERLKRDSSRLKAKEVSYQYTIENSGTLEDFLQEAHCLIDNIWNSL